MKNPFTIKLNAMFKEPKRYAVHNPFSVIDESSLNNDNCNFSFEGLDLRSCMNADNTNVVLNVNNTKYTNIKATCNAIREFLFDNDNLDFYKSDRKNYGNVCHMFDHHLKSLGIRLNFHPIYVTLNSGAKGSLLSDFSFKLVIELHSISTEEVKGDYLNYAATLTKKWAKHFDSYNRNKNSLKGSVTFKQTDIIYYADILRNRIDSIEYSSSVFAFNSFELEIIAQDNAMKNEYNSFAAEQAGE